MKRKVQKQNQAVHRHDGINGLTSWMKWSLSRLGF